MADIVTEFLWLLFGLATVVAVVQVTRWRREFNRSGWWTGIVVEGHRINVKVDQATCMGASSCVELAPEVFRLDWSKKKSTFDPAPLETLNSVAPDPQKVFKAAQSCPYRAIRLQDADTAEPLFP